MVYCKVFFALAESIFFNIHECELFYTTHMKRKLKKERLSNNRNNIHMKLYTELTGAVHGSVQGPYSEIAAQGIQSQ